MADTHQDRSADVVMTPTVTPATSLARAIICDIDDINALVEWTQFLRRRKRRLGFEADERQPERDDVDVWTGIVFHRRLWLESEQRNRRRP